MSTEGMASASPAQIEEPPRVAFVDSQLDLLSGVGELRRGQFVDVQEALRGLPDIALAGVWIEGDHIVIGIKTDAIGPALAAVLEPLGIPGVRFEIVDHSRADLRKVVDTVYDTAGFEEINSVTYHWARNQVVLTSSAPVTDVLRSQLHDVYGDAVAIDPEPQVPAEPARRDEDHNPFKGGFRYGEGTTVGGSGAGASCTGGFAWISPTGYQRLITAGHCHYREELAAGRDVLFTDYGGADHDYTYEVGEAVSSTADEDTGSVGTDGDLALINLERIHGVLISRDASPHIWWGEWDTPSYMLVTMVDEWSVNGSNVCSSGMKTGSLCGEDGYEDSGYRTTDVNYSYRDRSGRVWNNVALAEKDWGRCNRPGDSGGPVYWTPYDLDSPYRFEARAVGIIQGASGGDDDYYVGRYENNANCRLVFTEIGQAAQAFGGRIRLAPRP